MKLSEAKVDSLAEQIAEMLQDRVDLELHVNPSRLRVLIRQALLEELLVEDRLEEEVRKILQQYDQEIRRGRLSYNTLFSRIKSQLVRERGLVL
jgi:hypothetical protein